MANSHRLHLLPTLYVITPDQPLVSYKKALKRLVANVDVLVQLRRKSVDESLLLAEAKEIASLCRDADRPFIVNDHPQIADTSGADGVHLGARDATISSTQNAFPHLIIGATCRNPADAIAAEKAGASYVGVGPAYNTTTKRDAPEPIGVSGVRMVANAITIPSFAIGGISHTNARPLIKAGAYGVAVVSSIFSNDGDPQESAQRISQCLTEVDRATETSRMQDRPAGRERP